MARIGKLIPLAKSKLTLTLPAGGGNHLGPCRMFASSRYHSFKLSITFHLVSKQNSMDELPHSSYHLIPKQPKQVNFCKKKKNFSVIPWSPSLARCGDDANQITIWRSFRVDITETILSSGKPFALIDRRESALMTLSLDCKGDKVTWGWGDAT